jgi:hypothetical protein
VGVGLGLAVAWVTANNNFYLYNTFLGGHHFPASSLLAVMFLALVFNVLARRLRPAWAFTPQELILVWTLLVVMTGIPYDGFMRALVPVAAAPLYFANPGNAWAREVIPRMKEWSFLNNADAAKWFWEGLPAGEKIPWGAWGAPAAAWSAFFLLSYGVMFSLSVLLRGQWAERERLSFPLIALPLEMVKAPEPGRAVNSFFRNPVLWVGVAVPVLVHGINLCARFWPAIPEIRLFFPIHPYFRGRPWNGIGWVSAQMYFAFVGISFLISLDISLSFWLLYWVRRVEGIVGTSLGLDLPSARASLGDLLNAQDIGLFVAVVVSVLWLARRHLGHLLRVAFSRRAAGDDRNEALSCRAAVLTLGLGLIGMIAFLSALGLPAIAAAFVTAIYLVILIGLTWVVVATGLLVVLTPFHPAQVLFAFAGTGCLRPGTLVPWLYWERMVTVDLREFMMPNFMHSLRAAELTGLRPRKLPPVFALALTLTIFVAFVSSILVVYRYGGGRMHDWWAFGAAHTIPENVATNIMRYPKQADWTQGAMVGAGAGLAALMLFLRLRVDWWPLHPVGLAMSNTYALYCLWFPFLIGWLSKLLVLRYLGLRGLRRVQPFFLGLVLGDALMTGVWIVAGSFVPMGPYWISPG